MTADTADQASPEGAGFQLLADQLLADQLLTDQLPTLIILAFDPDLVM